eukprot:1180215-Prorocentrum_minimum.AAC.5
MPPFPPGRQFAELPRSCGVISLVRSGCHPVYTALETHKVICAKPYNTPSVRGKHLHSSPLPVC